MPASGVVKQTLLVSCSGRLLLCQRRVYLVLYDHRECGLRFKHQLACYNRVKITSFGPVVKFGSASIPHEN